MKLSVFLLLFSVGMHAAEVTCSAVWARATSPSAINGAVFVTVSNAADHDDQLVAVAVGPEIADRAELHGHEQGADGVMRMRPVATIAAPAGGIVQLQPGGHHIMLLGLKKPLIEGARVPLTLTFAQAGAVAVTATVAGIAAMAAPAACCPQP